MASRIPAFRAALKGVIEAALPGVQVTVGHPYPAPAEELVVIIGDASDRQLDHVLAGTAANETWTQEVMVSVVLPSQVPYSEALAEAYGAADAIASAITSWRESSYGGACDACLVKGGSDAEALVEGAREAVVTLELAVTARIELTG